MKIIKASLIFLSGVGVGLSAGMLYFKKYYENVSAKEIHEAYSYYHAKYNPDGDDRTTEDGTWSDSTISSDQEITSEEEVVENDGIAELEKGKPSLEDIYNEKVKHYAEAEAPTEGKYGPYEISEKEFSEENLNYSKITLKFYQEDGVLVDENEEEIISVDDYIGIENLEIFANSTEDCMHIRNDNISTDYEVERELRSFH